MIVPSLRGLIYPRGWFPIHGTGLTTVELRFAESFRPARLFAWLPDNASVQMMRIAGVMQITMPFPLALAVPLVPTFTELELRHGVQDIRPHAPDVTFFEATPALQTDELYAAGFPLEVSTVEPTGVIQIVLRGGCRALAVFGELWRPVTGGKRTVQSPESSSSEAAICAACTAFEALQRNIGELDE